MSSIRTRIRKDGTCSHQVMFRLDGKQSSESFEDPKLAARFKDLVDSVGPAAALDIFAAKYSDGGLVTVPSLREAITDHIDNLTGVETGTKRRYRRFLANDLEPFEGGALVALPVDAVTRQLVAAWVTHLEEEKGNGPKTIANKFAFLSGVFKALALDKGNAIESNPCLGVRLPRVDPSEMCFLEQDEFAALVEVIPERWRTLAMFLAASGARFGEASALTVGDINVGDGTCRISKAWKYTGKRRHVGKPKTKKSIRTINLDPELVALLPLRGRPRSALLFEHNGHQVEVTSFYRHVWTKAVDQLADLPNDPLNGKRPRIHDMRHTCASWMLNAGVPLHVIQAHLGHESVKTTADRYGHLDRRSGSAAAAVVGAMLPITRTPEPPRAIRAA